MITPKAAAAVWLSKEQQLYVNHLDWTYEKSDRYGHIWSAKGSSIATVITVAEALDAGYKFVIVRDTWFMPFLLTEKEIVHPSQKIYMLIDEHGRPTIRGSVWPRELTDYQLQHAKIGNWHEILEAHVLLTKEEL